MKETKSPHAASRTRWSREVRGGGGDWCCLGYPGNNPFKMVDARSGEGRGGHLLWKIIWFCALGPVGFQKFITTGGKKKKDRAPLIPVELKTERFTIQIYYFHSNVFSQIHRNHLKFASTSAWVVSVKNILSRMS